MKNGQGFLAEDNRVSMENVFYVPVGMLGDGIEGRQRYFHRMFNLPDNERVLLQFGSIHPPSTKRSHR